MERETKIEELQREYINKITKKIKDKKLRMNESTKIWSLTKISQRKDKFYTTMKTCAVCGVVTALYGHSYLGPALLEIIPSFIPTACVPLLFMGAMFGGSLVMSKIGYKIFKWDENAEKYSNVKTDSEKIEAYLENRIEMEKTDSSIKAILISYLKTEEKKRLFNFLSNNGKERLSEEIAETTKELTKAEEKLNKLSTVKALKRELIDNKVESLGIVLSGAAATGACLLAMQPILTSTIASAAIFAGGVAVTGLYTTICDSKIKKVFKKVLEKNKITIEKFNETDYVKNEDAIAETIGRIAEYSGTLQMKKVMQEIESMNKEEEKTGDPKKLEAMEEKEKEEEALKSLLDEEPNKEERDNEKPIQKIIK